MQYRAATYQDSNRVMQIIGQAQAQMRSQGSLQWQNGYPALRDIERDIEHNWGIVACKEEVIIAYAAVVFDGEPAYKEINGAWLSEQPYVVVHRLAVSDEEKGCGRATDFMRHIEQITRDRGVGSFRIDTNFDNHYMQRILSTLGFTLCGEINYENAPRMAYEKLLG